MTIQETTTSLSAAEALQAAESFFIRTSPFSATVTQRTATSIRLFCPDHGDVVLATLPTENGMTRVRGSSSRGSKLLASFLSTIGGIARTSSVVKRHQLSREHRSLFSEPTKVPATLPLSQEGMILVEATSPATGAEALPIAVPLASPAA